MQPCNYRLGAVSSRQSVVRKRSPRFSNKGRERTCWFRSKIATSFLAVKSSKFFSIVLISVSILARLKPEGFASVDNEEVLLLVLSYVPDSSEEESCDRVL